MKGRSFLSRSCDDFVSGVERAEDGRRMLAVLPKRWARFTLASHSLRLRLV
jgi:hypothetical protein